jgi:multiple sugar transport system ATP-binding protein
VQDLPERLRRGHRPEPVGGRRGVQVLVGPSGCDKTTALRMVAGLEEITSGTLRIGDRVASHISSRDRDIAMVFQNYALYRHMTVAGNIAFSLQGQRQRIAMGRAIVRGPAIFLIDEPLSNLDAKLRVQMRAKVGRIQRPIGVATIYVTHDQIEAMTMSDRAAVLRAGQLQQCDYPEKLYSDPLNVFVAAFVGSPPMNLFVGLLSPDGSSVRLGSRAIDLPSTSATRTPAGSLLRPEVVVGIRRRTSRRRRGSGAGRGSQG